MDDLLNFVAIAFISQMDETAFTLACKCYYGVTLQKEAKRISNEPLPQSITSTKRRCLTRATLLLTSLGMLIPTFICMYYQTNGFLLPSEIAVEFDETSELSDYGGCYSIEKSTTKSKRALYNGASGKVNFGYCKKREVWILYSGQSESICDIYEEDKDLSTQEKKLLAYSSRTNSFNIESTFESPWFGRKRNAIDLTFFDLADGQSCDEFFAGNAVCDSAYNTKVNDYDGGDCCGDNVNTQYCSACECLEQ